MGPARLSEFAASNHTRAIALPFPERPAIGRCACRRTKKSFADHFSEEMHVH
jgi:hypothetical protein